MTMVIRKSPFGPDDTITDIGAFYFHHNVGVTERRLEDLPASWSLSPAYPNPFNLSDTVVIALP